MRQSPWLRIRIYVNTPCAWKRESTAPQSSSRKGLVGQGDPMKKYFMAHAGQRGGVSSHLQGTNPDILILVYGCKYDWLKTFINLANTWLTMHPKAKHKHCIGGRLWRLIIQNICIDIILGGMQLMITTTAIKGTFHLRTVSHLTDRSCST